MKPLAKYHVCNQCVISEKTFKNILIGPVNYQDFRETGPWSHCEFVIYPWRMNKWIWMYETHIWTADERLKRRKILAGM